MATLTARLQREWKRRNGLMAVDDLVVTRVAIDKEGQVARLALYDVRHLTLR